MRHPLSVIANIPLNIYLKSDLSNQTEIIIANPKIPSKSVSLNINILGISIKSVMPPKNNTDPDEKSAKIGVWFSTRLRIIKEMTVAIIMAMTPVMKSLISNATRNPRIGPNSHIPFINNLLVNIWHMITWGDIVLV